ncbi:DUF6587 family protein [Variovorax sp. OV329]|uniref:DUF6587 family protein n=1 Tax=Variovorax sp. OV329 TaxID=1882825 RepID=UPI0008E5A87C|nr:DUF6587 family protein [Variovorax sp. OV329]SFM08317.1 hypothetical protein SAMN05444747_102352 [Variovorax sp. OV329]
MQEVIVALIGACAALYLAWRYMPGAWRRALAAKMAAGGQRAGLVNEQGAQKLAATLSKSSGCGACDSCSPTCASKGQAAPNQKEPTEVPLTRMR